MIKQFKTIDNFGVFSGFDWKKEAKDNAGAVLSFKQINIIYGRNYSGKTTLSRILRGMETGGVSNKFLNPAFCVKLSDGAEITQATLSAHSKKIRVFNEDFVRDNLHFITNPDDNIRSFAILGEDNNRIESEIATIEGELGSSTEGCQTGLYGQREIKRLEFERAKEKLEDANKTLDKQLSDKATSQKIGIKYKYERFGDQNYNITKLLGDIARVQDVKYISPSSEEVVTFEKLIAEKPLSGVLPGQKPRFSFEMLVAEAEALIIKPISESNKIQELVKNAVLNRWVKEGRSCHRGQRNVCAFCGNQISDERWLLLDAHFDEASELLEKDLNDLIAKVDLERIRALSWMPIDKSFFYSALHRNLDELCDKREYVVNQYVASLDSLLEQLKSRKNDILNQKTFEPVGDVSSDLLSVWQAYENICKESNGLSDSLSTKKKEAQECLRLKEVSDYLLVIGYQTQRVAIDGFEITCREAEISWRSISEKVSQKKELLTAKKGELRDERKGVEKVNEYLNDFFGCSFLSLVVKEDRDALTGTKQTHFEVIRSGQKAYHLSEGERSLLAFCYFLARLDDIDTRGGNPIIWIDDPISSLDGNHIFFVYSLLYAKIVSTGNFEQLFVSTHNLDFLKYLRRLNHSFIDPLDGKQKFSPKGYYMISRRNNRSTISEMPHYLKEYATEFNYLFHQIYKCATIETITDENYSTFYNFGNNARKFLEIYLYYRCPNEGMTDETIRLFLGGDVAAGILTDRVNNEYSHLCGVFERGGRPIEVPEMSTIAKRIIEKLKEDDKQYESLLRSVGEVPPPSV